jgi:outer membrane protein OmpA-like peptidoglycan-associated protein
MMTNCRLAVALSLLTLVAGIDAPPANAAQFQPHKALYALSLGSAKTSSGVLGADGAMLYEWGETCTGWTTEQDFRLRLEYADQDATSITSDLVTWESKDGSRYRFNERRLRNGSVDQVIKGKAHNDIPKSYVLGFDGGSARLSDEAREIVVRAATAIRRSPGYRVLVVAGAATAGVRAVAAENQRLARRRTDRVRQALLEDGVEPTAVQIAPGGTSPSATLAAQETSGPAPVHPVEIYLDPVRQGGVAEFSKPEQATIPLKPGVLFPNAHTLFLIHSAETGVPFVVRHVFDGTTVDDATMISAVIGPTLAPGVEGPGEHPIKSPLLNRPSWRMRLAFFPADSKSQVPDYELSMRLMDNGVSQDMSLDYGDYVIKATLQRIEALAKPDC